MRRTSVSSRRVQRTLMFRCSFLYTDGTRLRKLCNLNQNPAKLTVSVVLRFLHGKKLSSAEIHRQITEVYVKNVMSDNEARQWCRDFSGDYIKIHDEDCSG